MVVGSSSNSLKEGREIGEVFGEAVKCHVRCTILWESCNGEPRGFTRKLPREGEAVESTRTLHVQAQKTKRGEVVERRQMG